MPLSLPPELLPRLLELLREVFGDDELLLEPAERDPVLPCELEPDIPPCEELEPELPDIPSFDELRPELPLIESLDEELRPEPALMPPPWDELLRAPDIESSDWSRPEAERSLDWSVLWMLEPDIVPAFDPCEPDTRLLSAPDPLALMPLPVLDETPLVPEAPLPRCPPEFCDAPRLREAGWFSFGVLALRVAELPIPSSPMFPRSVRESR